MYIVYRIYDVASYKICMLVGRYITNGVLSLMIGLSPEGRSSAFDLQFEDKKSIKRSNIKVEVNFTG